MVMSVYASRKGRQIVLAAVLAVTTVSAFPAHAQRNDPSRGGVDAYLDLDGARLSLSRQELEAFIKVRNTLGSSAPQSQDSALAAARRAVKGPDGRHVLALYQLQIAKQRNDIALRREALDTLIASKISSPEKLPGYLAERGGIAYQLGDFQTARTLWTRLLDMKPADPDLLGNLALVYQAENDVKGAADMLQRAAAARRAAGEVLSETLYRQQLSIADQAKLVEPGIAAAHSLVRTYPSAGNWRDALLVYRQLVAPAGGFEIDLFRLMRVSGTLARADEYQRMAQLLKHAGIPAEAKAVLGEGLSRGLLNAGESPTREIMAEVDRAAAQAAVASTAGASATGDSLLGNGRYAEAAAHYRQALAMPAVNKAEVNTRLGTALFLAGQHAEAEVAFRMAANDAAIPAQPTRYPDLAQFWLSWLARGSGEPAPSSHGRSDG